jgi:hypothetical protein
MAAAGSLDLISSHLLERMPNLEFLEYDLNRRIKAFDELLPSMTKLLSYLFEVVDFLTHFLSHGASCLTHRNNYGCCHNERVR